MASSPTPSVAAPLATTGLSGAAASVVMWALGQMHVQIPSDIAANMVVLAIAAAHAVVALVGARRAAVSAAPSVEPPPAQK